MTPVVPLRKAQCHSLVNRKLPKLMTRLPSARAEMTPSGLPSPRHFAWGPRRESRLPSPVSAGGRGSIPLCASGPQPPLLSPIFYTHVSERKDGLSKDSLGVLGKSGWFRFVSILCFFVWTSPLDSPCWGRMRLGFTLPTVQAGSAREHVTHVGTLIGIPFLRVSTSYRPPAYHQDSEL